jgi:hypothetical protein
MTEAMTARCPWWRAWWHRRKRQIDHAVMWRVLRAKAAIQHPDDEEAAVLLTLKGWARFIQQPGQEHWLCACADDEPTRRNP